MRLAVLLQLGWCLLCKEPSFPSPPSGHSGLTVRGLPGGQGPGAKSPDGWSTGRCTKGKTGPALGSGEDAGVRPECLVCRGPPGPSAGRSWREESVWSLAARQSYLSVHLDLNSEGAENHFWNLGKSRGKAWKEENENLESE